MIRFKVKKEGDSEKFLKSLKLKYMVSRLEHYAQQGVEALSAATPVDSGKTAESWSYKIVEKTDRKGTQSISVIWTNSNVNQGVSIAFILQSGHGTGTGGYVQGIDYINPAINPILEKMKKAFWKEVIS